jgi:hypothetical protein
MQKYHARVAELTPRSRLTALKRPWEATASAPEPITYRKRGVAADVPPTKQRQKTVEEKALVRTIVADYVKVRTRHESLHKVTVETLAEEPVQQLICMDH